MVSNPKVKVYYSVVNNIFIKIVLWSSIEEVPVL